MTDPQKTASLLVNARKNAQSLDVFPGDLPQELKHGYQIQDAAIELWDKPIGGWKVGRIPPEIEAELGIDRLTGPIFADTIRFSDLDESIDMPMIVGGFAAIEAEFVAVIAQDAPEDKLVWSLDESFDMISDLRIGLEVASSPLASINDLGPTAVVSDFGNNLGLVVGPSIKNWRTRSLESMQVSTAVEGTILGKGGAFTLTGGFLRSVQFLLQLMATRGRPLRAGDLIATGQTNGIHDIKNTQTGEVDFGDDGKLCVRMQAAKPTT